MSEQTTATATGHRDEQGVDADVVLNEWDESDPLPLTKADTEMIDREVNAERTQLGYEIDHDGSVRLDTTHYVGIVTLPSGITVEIRPKAAEGNLLYLFRYARGVSTATIDTETELDPGREFVDALAALFLDELETLNRRGLHKAYQETSGTEEYLRGRLDVHRQLQRQGWVGTDFECTYPELTADTTANRAVLYATVVLGGLAESPGLRKALQRHAMRLRRRVTQTRVRPAELDQIELTRLNDYYTDLLRLAELVIRGVYIEEFSGGDRPSFALLMDMNRVYEAVVERAARAAITDRDGWTVEGQARTSGLIRGGKHPVRMRPDFIVRDETGTARLVGDAKWKVGTPAQADLYQIAAYQLADDVPGMLVYPAQDGEVETEYTVRETFPLRLIELPTDEDTPRYRDFSVLLEREVSTGISESLR